MLPVGNQVCGGGNRDILKMKISCYQLVNNLVGNGISFGGGVINIYKL